VKRGTCDRPVTISGEPGPLRGWGRRLIAAQLRPLGYELASPGFLESRVSQTCRSQTITRPICAATYGGISSVAPRFVHKSIHNTLRGRLRYSGGTTFSGGFSQRSKTSSVLEAVATVAPEASVTTPSVNPTRVPDLTTVPVAVSRPLLSRTVLR
jgi:hypothetical protein